MSTTRSKTAKAEADPPNPETVHRTTAYAGDEATVTATPHLQNATWDKS